MLNQAQLYPIPRAESLLDRLIIQLGHSAGICPICGKATVFFKFNENLRETGTCVFCRSTNRNRQLALVFLNAIAEMTGRKSGSIQQFSKRLNQKITIYNTDTFTSLHRYLKRYSNYIASEYFGSQYQSGTVVNQVIHQDLMATSFDSESIDILLSSDVFEHIPDPYRAFAEVHRILKPGGRHIFTVPFYQERYRDEVRATLDSRGMVHHLLPPIYHGDPLRPDGILVYVIFALEMLLKLHDLGYETRMYRVYDCWRGVLGANALVFESIKCDM